MVFDNFIQSLNTFYHEKTSKWRQGLPSPSRKLNLNNFLQISEATGSNTTTHSNDDRSSVADDPKKDSIASIRQTNLVCSIKTHSCQGQRKHF